MLPARFGTGESDDDSIIVEVCPANDEAIRVFPTVMPGRDEVASFDVQLHIRESIATTVRVDSGRGPSDYPGMTKRWIGSLVSAMTPRNFR
jgi:hypothetical protein